jgi:endonuclease/exonuclease/phosphatase family metal-dependent hydrolase
VTAASGHTFAVNLGPVAQVDLERGYVVVDATIDGREYRLVSTHPEPDFGVSLARLRQVQALELATVLAGQPLAVLMGDLNDVPGSPLP